MRRAFLLACLVLLPLEAAARQSASPQAAPAVARFIGKPVVEIEVVVEDRLSPDPALRDLIEVTLNAPLALADVRESIRHLFSLGRFQDIQVEAFDAPNGVRLRFNLIPMHAVERVEFEGTLGLSERLLRNTMSSRYGSTPAAGRAADVVQTLETLYVDHGYLAPSIQPRVSVEHDPDRTVLVFEIDAGPQARIAGVTVSGDPLQPQASFLRAIDAAPNRAYEPAKIRRGLDEWIRRMRRSDRYEAIASHRRQPSDDRRTVELTIDVQPGPVVDVQFTGDPLPKDRLDELVPIEREGSVDVDLIEDSERRIVAFLQQQGYAKARVTTERRESEGRLAIVFNVQRGAQYRVDGVDLTGNTAIPASEFAVALARLGPGDIYVESNVDAVVGAIRETYLRRGHAQVKVDSSVNEKDATTPGQGLVRPAIVVSEGPQRTVGSIVFDGNEQFSDAALADMVSIRAGAPLYEPTLGLDTGRLLLEYQDAGFWSVHITPAITLSAEGARADVTFTIEEGPQTLVDHILIVGNVKTDPQVIQRELLLKPGEPLGLSDLIRSQQRVSALGLFRRVAIREIAHSGSMRRDVLVSVEEAPSTSLSYGGGMEVAQRQRAGEPGGTAETVYELAPRGFFDIGRRNVGGRNRTVNLYSRLSLRPDAVVDPQDEGNLFGFSEYRVVATYRQPRAAGFNADLTISAAAEQGIRSSFNFGRKGLNADVLRRLGPTLRVSGRYTLAATKIFDVQPDLLESDTGVSPLERVFSRVRLSSFGITLVRDTRDDALEPQRGSFVSAEGSLAARALGGQAGFVKSYVQGFWYKQLPGRRGIVFATRTTIGLADGFPREVDTTDEQGNPVTSVTEDLPASERFFAGGDTTIRGFGLDAVGAPNTISPQGFARGGNALLIVTGELRVPLWKGIAVAAFVDGGNVFERVSQFDVSELRGSVGFGIRYRSPIGPLRFDVGFKLDKRANETNRHVFHWGIGQAF
jgi:outer membrane protein assembly factor BamA